MLTTARNDFKRIKDEELSTLAASIREGLPAQLYDACLHLTDEAEAELIVGYSITD